MDKRLKFVMNINERIVLLYNHFHSSKFCDETEQYYEKEKLCEINSDFQRALVKSL